MSSKFLHYANKAANISETLGQTFTTYDSFYLITHVCNDCDCVVTRLYSTIGGKMIDMSAKVTVFM